MGRTKNKDAGLHALKFLNWAMRVTLVGPPYRVSRFGAATSDRPPWHGIDCGCLLGEMERET